MTLPAAGFLAGVSVAGGRGGASLPKEMVVAPPGGACRRVDGRVTFKSVLILVLIVAELKTKKGGLNCELASGRFADEPRNESEGRAESEREREK
jgi:hypothetical protein